MRFMVVARGVVNGRQRRSSLEWPSVRERLQTVLRFGRLGVHRLYSRVLV
jgi:hypothetical protein